SDMYSFGL
uniref:Carcinustatin-18 n=1 Tax=Carcinus maenas TaxID=6759 RepID=ALL18_CARMA|nr:RecName: Full=Carcinustatin-18 [Carcinus maenas]